MFTMKSHNVSLLKKLYTQLQEKYMNSALKNITATSWLILFTIVVFFYWCITIISSLPLEYKVALIAFVGTVFGAIYAQVKSKQRENESRLFPQKALAYKKMFDLVGGLFDTEGKKSGNNKGDKIVDSLRDFQKDILIWGSARTLKAYNRMMSKITVESVDPVTIALELNNLFSEMRKDLGHNDKGLTHLELIGIFIKSEDKQKFFDGDIPKIETPPNAPSQN